MASPRDDPSAGNDTTGEQRPGTLAEFDKDYRFGKVCGQGTFGSIVRVLHCSTRTVVAGRRYVIPSDVRLQELHGLLEAFGSLRQVVHPRLLAHQRVFVLRDKSKPTIPTSLLLLTEYVGGGELFDNIVECPLYSEQTARSIVQSLLVGLAVLHKAGITHHRLVPTAILLAQKGQFSSLKICDPLLLRTAVGNLLSHRPEIKNSEDNAKALDALSSSYRRSVPGYCAPENYDDPEEVESASAAAAVVGADDMWTVGIIAYTLLCGYQPFTATSLVRVHFCWPLPGCSAVACADA